MSTYAQIQGELNFESKEKLDLALEILTKGEWVKNGCWINEMGNFEDKLDISDLRLEIPRNDYRNLLPALNSLVKHAFSWDIVWASNDGMFSGGIISSGGNKTVELNEWAVEGKIKWSERKWTDDTEDERYAYQQKVMDSFVEDYGE
jgi:hypothetical protein